MGKIRYIYSEKPYQKMWDTFVFLESEPAAKEFLSEKYQKTGSDESYKFAFNNATKFIYFIKQAKAYFQAAEKSDNLVKPLLLYYGMMNLMKTVILTLDPTYPSRTGVLRHGVTTRKLKKTDYQFHDDELKIQKEGLLPWFYTLITASPIEKIEGNKYKNKELLALLPELSESYKFLYDKQMIYPIEIQKNSNNLELSVDRGVLSFYNNDTKIFLQELNGFRLNKLYQYSIKDLSQNTEKLLFTLDSEIPSEESNKAIFFQNPLIIQDFKGNYYIRPYKESRFILPELMIDFMLMYNLGMLCRYETELWGEIIYSFNTKDIYIINEFINSTTRKFPNLILNALFDELIIFKER